MGFPKRLILFYVAYLPICLIILGSCATKSNMLLFQDAIPLSDAEGMSRDTISQRELLIIRPFDILQITVQTPDPEISNTFGDFRDFRTGTGDRGNPYQYGYLVDEKGEIDVPLIGRINVHGLTVNEAKDLLESLILQYTTIAHVRIKFLTFKVYIFGEVGSPGVITIPNERSTLIEALSIAGDINDMADRRNIKILRGDPANPVVYEIDIRNTKSFTSPGFKLHPNDIIYVQPANRKFMSMISRDVSVLLTFVNSALLLVSIYNLLSN